MLNWLLPPIFLGRVSLILGVIPLTLLVVAIIAFIYFASNSGENPMSLNWRGVELIKLRFVEGFRTLWFVRFISSQYLIKDTVKYGAGLIYVVDRGWVEMRTGQGALRRRSTVAS